MDELELEDRLRRHFADRATKEPIPSGPERDVTAAPRSRAVPRWLAAAAAVAALVAGAVVALSDDDDQVDTSIDPSTTVTDAPTSTSTSTTEPSTTTSGPARPSSFAAVVSIDGLLGWWDGTGWIDAEQDQAAPLRGGEAYLVFGVTSDPRSATGSAVTQDDEFCDPGQRVDVGIAPFGESLDPPEIAVHGVAQPLVRRVEVLDPTAPAYVEAASSALASLVGVDDPEPELSQLLRTDLDGDGTDEVLMVIERLTGDHLYAEDGDYSVVVARAVVGGQPVDRLLYESVASGDPAAGETPFISVARVSAIADLNGDGSMEVALFQRYYEGHGTTVYEVAADGRATKVLDAGCGV